MESVGSGLRSLDLDTVCLAGPRSPRTRLPNVLGCPHSDKPVLGGLVPVHDRWMETPLPGLLACGDAAGVEDGAVSLESGRLAYIRTGSRGRMRRDAKAALSSQHKRLVR